MMYEIQQILKGIKKPKIALRVIRGSLFELTVQRLQNKKKALQQRNTDSRFGLVVDWGFHKLGRWQVAQYPYLIEELIDIFDPVILSSQHTYDRHKDDLDYILSFEPNSNKTPSISIDTEQGHGLGIFVGHTHDKTDWFDDYVYDNHVDHVFSPYYHPFLTHFPDFDESRLVHLPWGVPDGLVIDPREICYRGQDVIHSFGATGSEMYAERERINRYNFVKYHNRSGASKRMTKEQVENYYRWCGSFDAAVAAGSFDEKYQYTYAKYFEIPASGSLLFAQYCRDLDRLGFTEDNCILFREGEFEQKYRRYLEHPSDYLETRRNSVQLIRDRHTISDRVRRIWETVASHVNLDPS